MCHVLRRDLEVGWRSPRGRPKMRWNGVVMEATSVANDGTTGRTAIRSVDPTLEQGGAEDLERLSDKNLKVRLIMKKDRIQKRKWIPTTTKTISSMFFRNALDIYNSWGVGVYNYQIRNSYFHKCQGTQHGVHWTILIPVMTSMHQKIAYLYRLLIYIPLT